MFCCRETVSVSSESCLITIRFLARPDAERYATAVLACHHVLTFVGLGELATVVPDDTATDDQINQVSDRWTATNPWSL